METPYLDFEENENIHIDFYIDELFNEIHLFKSCFNEQQLIIDIYMTAILAEPNFKLKKTEQALIQSYIKSTLLLYNAHKLTLQGNYGIARTLLRQIFEYLLIGKYFSIKKNEIIAEQWFNKQQFDTYNKIIKLLNTPDKKNLSYLWKSLCTQAHACTNACQVGNDHLLNRNDIVATYYIILILITCKYYLLECLYQNANMTQRVKDNSPELFNKLTSLHDSAKSCVENNLANISQDAADLVLDFRENWTFKK